MFITRDKIKKQVRLKLDCNTRDVSTLNNLKIIKSMNI